ncbi:amylo-alpha-1,6-glucosidase [Fluviispira vulneris]|uniref:amylo-alpha-1,6-glucosidase n=1 Tax=Fluviispira vulneris TaxID=2763012 RepID=UPI001646480F|nr:amylo-alpha-1,6-glucosidase [Fluviispira vulneris]
MLNIPEKKELHNFSYLNKTQIDLDLNREWLITNGLGSYASGTLSGTLTRRYHGLFVVAQTPPLGRILFVSKIEEEIIFSNKKFLLSSNKWGGSENIFPNGYLHINSFYLDEDIPTWLYQCEDVLLEKKIFFEHEKNSIYITYKILSDNTPNDLKIICKVFVNNRDFHGLNREINVFSKIEDKSIRFLNKNGNLLFSAYTNFSNSSVDDTIYYNYLLEEERQRGFSFVENHKCAAIFSENISKFNDNLQIIISTEKDVDKNWKNVLQKLRNKNRENLFKFSQNNYTPHWIRQIHYAAHHFIVRRESKTDKNAKSILAGYHWFGDWGRDTFISLNGICCATGQYSTAKSILENYAKYIDAGMIPNRFPDYGENPDYNTADASLWYIEAVANYLKHTQDLDFLKSIFSTLEEIIESYFYGTRYNIKCDLKDGLIYAGEENLQLTWMDAKADGIVFTPRIGKPIEINALWYNALKNMNQYALLLCKENNFYSELIRQVENNFNKYWNEDFQYCFDVIDGPNGNDISLRPNQLIALSLKYCPLEYKQKKCIIDICGKELVTYFGVRSLAKSSNQYKGRCYGNYFARDSAYHQGTAWSWLLGVYAIAYFKQTQNASVAISFLEPLGKHINEYGIGFISEIFDGDAPFIARGCIAQAWSIAETLRAWKFLSSKLDPLKLENPLI